MKSMLRDSRGKISWGRVCSAIALIMAVAIEIRGNADAKNLALWLAVAVSHYGASKMAEAFTGGAP